MDQQTTTLPPPAPASATASVYAGFWRRLGAVLLDCLVIGIPLVIFNMMFLPVFGMTLISLVNLIVATAYYVTMHGRYGATLGKMALGIRVAQLDGTPINYVIAAWRYSPFIAIGVISILISSDQLSGALNFLYVIVAVIVLLVNDQKRTIHDFIAKTVVLKKKPVSMVTVPTP